MKRTPLKRRTPLKPSRKPMGSVTRGRDPQRYVTSAMKRRVLERDGWTCSYCGVSLGIDDAVIDHVVPWKDGGRTEMDNLVGACRPCNERKGNMSAEAFRALKG